MKSLIIAVTIFVALLGPAILIGTEAPSPECAAVRAVVRQRLSGTEPAPEQESVTT